jgi:hypothetical protein
MMVLGMHRSRPSPLTRVLGDLGASGPRVLLGPHEDNPDGHYELPKVVALDNNRLLRLAGLRWYEDDPCNWTTW